MPVAIRQSELITGTTETVHTNNPTHKQRDTKHTHTHSHIQRTLSPPRILPIPLFNMQHINPKQPFNLAYFGHASNFDWIIYLKQKKSKTNQS